MLFAFDLERRAILLVGGDKSDNWKGWYATNIPIAGDRFAKHQADRARKRPGTSPKVTKQRKGSKR